MIINDINKFYDFILNTDFDIVVRGREVFRDGEKIMEYRRKYDNKKQHTGIINNDIPS